MSNETATSIEPTSSRIDEVVDELLPADFDWRRLVRTYPIPSLAVAATGGFLLGLRHGKVLVSAVVAYASAEMSRNVRSLVDAGMGLDGAAAEGDDSN